MLMESIHDLLCLRFSYSSYSIIIDDNLIQKNLFIEIFLYKLKAAIWNYRFLFFWLRSSILFYKLFLINVIER